MRGVPGFQAEASLDPPWGRYRATAAFGAPRAAGGVSMQGWPTAVTPSLGLGINLFPPIRCCGFDPMWGRIVCVTQRARPWEDCECQHHSTGPLIKCVPRVFTTS
jgi:hypothetical protein